MPTAIVAGVLAGKSDNGGNAWSRVSLAVGLRRLGFEVIFIEALPSAPPADTTYFESVCTEFGLEGYIVGDPPPREVIERIESASLLLNIGGHLMSESLKGAPRVRVYLDDDP